MNPTAVPAASELSAAVLQAAITFGLAAIFSFLYGRSGKPYFRWFALAWALYLLRVVAIMSFLATGGRTWLYWHQVVTGWTALALLWAALVFSRQLAWRWRYLGLLLFPPVWSYVAIYRLENFLLAAGPAVLFLSVVTFWTGWIFLSFSRRVRSAGAALLAAALLLWGVHHLDYPFLRARGAWSPWGYYLDILFELATGIGILVLVLDDLRRGLAALSTLSGDLQRGGPDSDDLRHLLQRPLALPAARGSALYVLEGGRARFVRGVGVCAQWDGLEPAGAAARAITLALEGGRPQFTREWVDLRFPSSDPYAYAVVLPILRGTVATAALVIVGDARDPFAALDEDFLLALGQQIGAALENADLYRGLEARTAELTRLQTRMIEQHEEERRRLSLHLHDETAQVFAAVRLQLGVLREQADAPTAERLERALDLIDTGMRSIRNVTRDLRPSLLDDLGLVPALRSLVASFAERGGIAVEMEAPDAVPPLSGEAELALFRALQEALSNVVKHAAARRVLVRLAAGDGVVTLEVRDDGRGFGGRLDLDRFEREGHLGLAGMRERITALGGRVDVRSRAEGGAELVVRVPVNAAEGVIGGAGG
ncbi:MAG: GAF domain-containing sensor histidine kinase [Gemmatimonadetes bacterium]|nr:GAF domain-containing sensor histidine kinase [Gemmatimonadota bacterium]